MKTPAAIRLSGVGRYFGPRAEMDGADHPREAFRTLMRIAGLNVKAPVADLQATVAAPGHVLRDITLDIDRGSVVCLTGPTGSGKSVLLRMIAGALPPTTGSIEVRGAVRALLSMDWNLDMSLTGEENIQAAEAVATADPDAAARFAADVIEFAELQGFEQVPVRKYSTGMLVRLNVALALSGRPDIVLIDDVLAVGDIGFQQKCVARVHALGAAGCAIVMAVSDEALVEQLATRIVMLSGGGIARDTAEPAARPDAGHGASVDLEWQVAPQLADDDAMAFRSIEVAVEATHEETYLHLQVDIAPKLDGLRFRPVISVWDEQSLLLFRSLFHEFIVSRLTAPLRFAVRIPTRLLPPGRYMIGIGTVALQRETVFSTKSNDAVALTVRGAGAVIADDAGPPALVPSLGWELEELAVAEA